MSRVLYFITSEEKTGVELALENKDDEVSLVLMQNAVYFAAKKGTGIDDALQQGKTVYASKKDVELRGIQKLLPENVKLADYGEIVDIVFNQDSIINF